MHSRTHDEHMQGQLNPEWSGAVIPRPGGGLQQQQWLQQQHRLQQQQPHQMSDSSSSDEADASIRIIRTHSAPRPAYSTWCSPSPPPRAAGRRLERRQRGSPIEARGACIWPLPDQSRRLSSARQVAKAATATIEAVAVTDTGRALKHLSRNDLTNKTIIALHRIRLGTTCIRTRNNSEHQC